jgi:hypothetical protein
MPGVERVDLYEIARSEWGALTQWERRGTHREVQEFLKHPRIKTSFTDGRLALRIEPARYDVIEADPAEPQMAYSGNLYSLEFYLEARRRLSANGVFCTEVTSARVAGRTCPARCAISIRTCSRATSSTGGFRVDVVAENEDVHDADLQGCVLNPGHPPANISASPAAGVAELADAHGSGPCWLRLVWVQVPPPAPSRAALHPRPLRCGALAADEYTSFAGASRARRLTACCGSLLFA